MRERWKITEAKKTKDEMHLFVKDEIRLDDTTALGQMLVDSDAFAFIYILEKNNEYTYLVIPEHTWPQLNEALRESSRYLLSNGSTTIELPQFSEELEYLIANIQGNSNYGNEMVKKVEEVFC